MHSFAIFDADPLYVVPILASSFVYFTLLGISWTASETAISRSKLANYQAFFTVLLYDMTPKTGASAFFVERLFFEYVLIDLDGLRVCITTHLYKSFRLLFTGASSAATGSAQKGTKRCKAVIHGLTEPTPETIAYAAVLV